MAAMNQMSQAELDANVIEYGDERIEALEEVERATIQVLAMQRHRDNCADEARRRDEDDPTRRDWMRLAISADRALADLREQLSDAKATVRGYNAEMGLALECGLSGADHIARARMGL